MTLPQHTTPDRPTPVAVGMGRLTLDVLVRPGDPPALARSQAGGPCGNVLVVLSWLGWNAYPLANLGNDDPGLRVRADLTRFGVQGDLIDHVNDRNTPIILHTPGPSHSFSSHCPFCGQGLPGYEPIPLEQVEARLSRVPIPQVYFFDWDSDGALQLARHCRAHRALVVHAPDYAGPESQLDASLAVADVLVFSRESLGDLPHRHPLVGPLLIVETLGSQGLRYLDRRQPSCPWVHLPAVPVPTVRDAAGSGDWCLAGFLHRVGQGGRDGFLSALPQRLAGALRFGQALGAWNCAFEGARGGMYRADPTQFRADIRRLLQGECFDPGGDLRHGTQDVAGRFCPACRRRQTGP